MKNIFNNKNNLSFFPTPLYKLKTLSDTCSDYTVFIKRDDIGGLATGGNYTRKPEYLINQNLDEGCHIVVTVSAQQLINCWQTATVCTDYFGYDLPENGSEYSCNILSLLEGGRSKSLHKATVHHSMALEFAIKQGKWKLILCQGSGSWSHPNPWEESECFPELQLYDLESDPGKENNLQAQFPEKVKDSRGLLSFYIVNGRSTKGTPQHNDDPPMK